MRLTLRALLAHMDGLLEPEDADEISRKIEESPFANNLMNRTHEVVRRIGLAAPELRDRGPGLDPNTVAEYLDNVLDDQRVLDFEKLCLESDLHLAEVAACHQILTLVLGEPAEIEPSSREKMYALPQRAEEMAAAAAAATEADRAAAAKPDGAKPRPKPTVPDYLREPAKQRGWLPWIAGGMLAVGLLLIILRASGQLEPNATLRVLLESYGLLPPAAEMAVTRDTAVPPRAPLDDANGTGVPPADDPASAPASPEPAPGAEPAAAAAEASLEPPAGAGDVQPPTPESIPDVDRAAAPSGEAEPGPTAPPGALAPESGGLPAPLPPFSEIPGEGDGGAVPDTATTPSAVEAGVEPPVGSEVGGPPVDMPDRVGEELVADPDAETLPQPEDAPVRVGRLISQDQVLLRFDPETRNWYRVPSKGILETGTRLVALPTYRPEIGLSHGVTLQLVGASRVTLVAGSQEMAPGVQVDFGRILLMPLAEAGKRLHLSVGRHQGVVTLGDIASILAIEVTPVRIPSADPDKATLTFRADLYARHGHSLWQADDAGSQPIRLDAGTRLTLDDGPAASPAAVQQMPEWIDTDTTGLLDRRASSTLTQSLALDRPATLGLMEQADHRKEEVRWLAKRSLASLGHFDRMVAALNDEEYRMHWPDYIEQLRLGVSRGDESVAGVRQALERTYGTEAPAMFRMLQDYTEQELRNGEAAKLVEYLDHPTLAVRVLSFWNLKQLTGLGLFYKPELPEARRKQSVQRWRERLESGEMFQSLDSAQPAEPSAEAEPASGPASLFPLGG